jgi:hypothetical protein
MLKISYLKTGVSREKVLSNVTAAKAENPAYRVIEKTPSNKTLIKTRYVTSGKAVLNTAIS